MFCTKCGKAVDDDQRFCIYCGADLTGVPASQAPTPAPQTPAPAPAPAPAPRPAPAPAPAPAPRPVAAAPVSVPVKKKRGGMIALLVTVVVLALAAVALVVFLLLRDNDSSSPASPASPTPAGDLATPLPQSWDQPSGEEIIEAPVDNSFDFSGMDGTYYCAAETGSTLELYSTGDQLSIYKTYMGQVDVSTLIPLPAGPSFTINYGGRIIEFYLSSAGRSVTVSESGYSSIYTTDGDRNWVVPDRPDYDPFTDPNGYILPTDSRYIQDYELQGFDAQQLRYIRNEIYARYGYSFKDQGLRDYFASKNWYWENPSVNVNTFGTNQMNDYERANLALVQKFEEALR